MLGTLSSLPGFPPSRSVTSSQDTVFSSRIRAIASCSESQIVLEIVGSWLR